MTIHLVQAPLDMRKFNRWAGERGLVRRGSFDEGYGFHVLLSAMFGKSVLQPFRLFASERRAAAALYAYADVDAGELRRTAAEAAPPDCVAALDPDRMRSKPLPPSFEAGRRLGFDLRIRPVRRLCEDLPDPQQDGRQIRKGAEVDAFRVEALRRFPDGWAAPDASASHDGVTREDVYVAWLAERCGDAVVIERERCRLAAFKRSRAIRGAGRGPEGPDATLHGTLTVSNPERFRRMLRSGVGRHRAYGYGMLLLRPPDRPPPGR